MFDLEAHLFYWLHYDGWFGKVKFTIVYILWTPVLFLDWLTRK